MCDKVFFRHRESKMSAMNKISATSDSPFTFNREEGRGVFMVCKNKPDYAQIICSHNQAGHQTGSQKPFYGISKVSGQIYVTF